MKSKHFAAVFAVLALSVLSFAQGEHMLTNSNVGVTLGKAVQERMPGEIGVLHLVARHCDKYVRSGRSFLFFGKREWVDWNACQNDASTVYSDQWNHNSRTNAGRDFMAAQVWGTSGTTSCDYIAVTNDSTNPPADGSNTNTTLAAEITGGTTGLARALSSAGYAHSAGTNTVTLSHTFTGGSACPTGCVLQRAAVFTASSSGTMCFESATFSSVTLNSTSDTVAINWTFTY